MADFNGTVVIQNNPVTEWERYGETLLPSAEIGERGFFELEKEERAEGGYYRAKFKIRGDREFLADMLLNGLGRAVNIYTEDGTGIWEGYIDEMALDVGSATYRTSLRDMGNAVWMRFRVRGTTTTERSPVQTDDDSIARYGRKEFILSGGELEDTDTGDQPVADYLGRFGWPTPSPTQIRPERDLSPDPSIAVDCKGWFETLNWCVYNQTVSTDADLASGIVETIITDTDVAQFVKSYAITSNSTSIGKEYDADRKGGDILKDVARLGDSRNSRFLVYMTDGRKFVYEEAAPPDEP